MTPSWLLWTNAFIGKCLRADSFFLFSFIYALIELFSNTDFLDLWTLLTL